MVDLRQVWDFQNWQQKNNQYIERLTSPAKQTALERVELQVDESIPLGEIHVVDQVTGQRQIIKVNYP